MQARTIKAPVVRSGREILAGSRAPDFETNDSFAILRKQSFASFDTCISGPRIGDHGSVGLLCHSHAGFGWLARFSNPRLAQSSVAHLLCCFGMHLTCIVAQFGGAFLGSPFTSFSQSQSTESNQNPSIKVDRVEKQKRCGCFVVCHVAHHRRPQSSSCSIPARIQVLPSPIHPSFLPSKHVNSWKTDRPSILKRSVTSRFTDPRITSEFANIASDSIILCLSPTDWISGRGRSKMTTQGGYRSISRRAVFAHLLGLCLPTHILGIDGCHASRSVWNL